MSNEQFKPKYPEEPEKYQADLRKSITWHKRLYRLASIGLVVGSLSAIGWVFLQQRQIEEEWRRQRQQPGGCYLVEPINPHLLSVKLEDCGKLIASETFDRAVKDISELCNVLGTSAITEDGDTTRLHVQVENCDPQAPWSLGE